MNDSNLRILNWNVRGLNSAARREAVKIMIQQSNPTLICLQKTKLGSIDHLLAVDFLGQRFSNFFECIPADETRGGVLIAWDQDFLEGELMDRRLYCLSLKMTLKLENSSFFITSVYGPASNNSTDKDVFLNELRASQPAANDPWVCLGDFNLIYQARDKNNCNINRSHMRKFRQALDACELLEIVLQNKKYTWSNGQRNPVLVHLDRVFCNKEWEDMFTGYSLNALSSSLSDHCPLFLCKHSQRHRMASFKFESFWTRVPGFFETVQQAWDLPVRGTSPMMIFHNRLENTRTALKSWSKELFSEARLQLHMANEVIQRLDMAQESRTLSQAEFELHRDLKQHILGWSAVERSRRRQSSRLINLKEGDACTKFFHQKAKGRRKRNLIAYLKNDNGEMV